jgi:hypothetical protein
MNLDEPRTIAHDLAALIQRFEQKEEADKQHMKEMHAAYDEKIFYLQKRLDVLEKERRKEAEQAALIFEDIQRRLQQLEDDTNPQPGQGYRSLSQSVSQLDLKATPKRSSIVDEVFKARK